MQLLRLFQESLTCQLSIWEYCRTCYTKARANKPRFQWGEFSNKMSTDFDRLVGNFCNSSEAITFILCIEIVLCPAGAESKSNSLKYMFPLLSSIFDSIFHLKYDVFIVSMGSNILRVNQRKRIYSSDLHKQIQGKQLCFHRPKDCSKVFG